jgi:hypothetical protein
VPRFDVRHGKAVFERILVRADAARTKVGDAPLFGQMIDYSKQ